MNKDFDTSAFEWCKNQSFKIESEYRKIEKRQEILEEKERTTQTIVYCICFCMGALVSCVIAMIMGVL